MAAFSAGDHTLDTSTYLGGEDQDYLGRMAIGPGGGIFLAGSTRSVGFPTTSGTFQPQFDGNILGCEVPFGQDYNCEDMFLTKLTPDGMQLDYSTYLGGSTPDEAHGIAVGTDGGVYFAGATNVPADIYVVKLEGECIADFNNDGNVNTQDVLAFLNAWAAGDNSADINGDGVVNTQDVLAFLNLWNAGC